jgi:hypothetical protein
MLVYRLGITVEAIQLQFGQYEKRREGYLPQTLRPKPRRQTLLKFQGRGLKYHRQNDADSRSDDSGRTRDEAAEG